MPAVSVLASRGQAGTATSPRAPRAARRASLARVHDSLLGGRDNYPADRAALDRLLRAYPHYRNALLASRRFAMGAIRHMAGSGIRQYLDLGGGIPTRLSVHQLVRGVDAGARTVCVSEDRTAYAHSAIATAELPGVSVLRHDVSDAAGLLERLDSDGTLDLTRPVGVLCTEVLHLLDDGRARGIVHDLRRRLAPGSRLAFTVMGVGTTAMVQRHAARSHDIETLLGRTLCFRTPVQVAQLVAGAPVVPPGLVDLGTTPRAATYPRTARLTTVAAISRTGLADQHDTGCTADARLRVRRHEPAVVPATASRRAS